MFTVRMPIHGEAGLSMGRDLQHRRLVLAEIPTLDHSSVRTAGEGGTVRWRPSDVPDPVGVGAVLVRACKTHDTTAASHGPQVPEPQGGVLAAGEQIVTLVRVDGQPVDLAIMLV